MTLGKEGLTLQPELDSRTSYVGGRGDGPLKLCMYSLRKTTLVALLVISYADAITLRTPRKSGEYAPRIRHELFFNKLG
jgi:hypothetical protein